MEQAQVFSGMVNCHFDIKVNEANIRTCFWRDGRGRSLVSALLCKRSRWSRTGRRTRDVESWKELDPVEESSKTW